MPRFYSDKTIPFRRNSWNSCVVSCPLSRISCTNWTGRNSRPPRSGSWTLRCGNSPTPRSLPARSPSFDEFSFDSNPISRFKALFCSSLSFLRCLPSTEKSRGPSDPDAACSDVSDSEGVPRCLTRSQIIMALGLLNECVPVVTTPLISNSARL